MCKGWRKCYPTLAEIYVQTLRMIAAVWKGWNFRLHIKMGIPRH